MHLKRITICGFKSFADRVSLTFDRGITGVVGPNGSGKSNIIDAVRWVMGEQNAKNLRGEKATDIIFAGSDRRKALGMADVSLVFDNSDDSSFCPPEYRHEPEITLTRRLYVDGQREYLINRKPCRLKDIVGFFAMTGLGGRSYSMIQQGQVDRILNAKPEDVREILEEAAGTLLYKHRKAEAQKKLESTQLNLNRVMDILNEIERQQGTLKDQVEKAQRWQELTTDLKQQELTLFGHNYRHFFTKQNEIDVQLKAEQDREVEFFAKLAQFESRQQELQQVLDEADPGIATLNEEITVLREQIARAEATVINSLAKIDGGEKRLQQISFEVGEDSENLKVLESQVDGATSELHAAEKEAGRLRGVIEQFQAEVEGAEESAQVYRSRLEEMDDEVRNLNRLVDSNKYRIEALQRDMERIARVKTEHTARIQVLEQESTRTLELVELAQEKVSKQQAGLDVEIREKHTRESAVAQRYNQMKDAHQRRDERRERYHEARARITSLDELAAGATDVVGAVADLKAKAPAAGNLISGFLTDYLAFNDQAAELPRTMVGAFERWLERVLITDITKLNELVRLAQKHATGAIPVIVPDFLGVVNDEKLKKWVAATGAEPLSDYLRVDSTAQNSHGIGQLTKRLYLLSVLELSSNELKELPHGIVVFTAQGVCVAGDGEFVLGSKAIGGGLLSRKSEREHLVAELKVLESELAGFQAKIDELEMQINQDRQIVAEIDGRLQAQNKDVLGVMHELQAAQQQADHKQDLIGAAQKALAEQVSLELSLTKEIADLTVSRKAFEVELASLVVDMEGLKQEAAGLDERREESVRVHNARRMDLAKSEARAQAIKDSYVHTRAQLELLQNKLSRRYEEQSGLAGEIERAKTDLATAQGAIEGLIYKREDQERLMYEKREANAGVHEELRVTESRLRELREQQQKIQKSAADRNLSLERIKMAIAGVEAQALEKYQVDIKLYEFAFDEDFNLDKAGRQVSALRGKIEALGPVNMMAMKEFSDLSERENFIRGQHDEIIASATLLAEAIQEIEGTSKEKFLRIFATINENFGKLFPILFPGGEGHLELTNPDDPLQGGVEIMVRLPGKKMQRMNLFSGGEKALTAISLIFALLKTKPTPFCFLDEVDAPLDEANVGRYNRVLEALSEHFQFIIITHNRRTMEVLDTLYGITMQEPGVSSVVGVDMKQDLPPHLRKAFKEVSAEKASLTGERQGASADRQGAVAAGAPMTTSAAAATAAL